MIETPLDRAVQQAIDQENRMSDTITATDSHPTIPYVIELIPPERQAEARELFKIAAGLFGDGMGNELADDLLQNPQFSGAQEYERGACEVLTEYLGLPMEYVPYVQRHIHHLAQEQDHS